MTNGGLLRALLATAALFTGASRAAAQLAAPAPVRQSIDSNGVDLFLGTINVDAPVLSIGSDQGVSFQRLWRGSGWTDNVIATLYSSGGLMTVSLGGVSDSFTISGTTFNATQGNGASLALSSNIYTYTRADGTLIHFDANLASPGPYFANAGRVTDITSPTGAKLTFAYESLAYCSDPSGPDCERDATAWRITTVHNSYGYQLAFTYLSNMIGLKGDPTRWSTISVVTATNLAVASGASTPSETLATTTSGSDSYDSVTDALNRTTNYRTTGGVLTGIRRPNSTSDDVTIAFVSGKVSSVTRTVNATDVLVTNYMWSDTGSVRTATVTDPLSHITTYKFDSNPASGSYGRVKSITDAKNNTTAYQYDGSGRVTRVTQPEMNYTSYIYDARGNLTESDTYDKTGANPLALKANYPATCSNKLTCNEPTWTKDARGNQTDYSYDYSTGLPWYITSPAPSAGAARPQTRYCYSRLQAYFAPTPGGTIVASGEFISQLVGVSSYRTGAAVTNTTVAPACTGTGTSDEVRTAIAYQTATGGNNVLPLSVTRSAGDGSVSATTAYGYDDIGNLTSVDGPLGGPADTTTYFFDADREALGAIAPDPDGDGSGLKRRAQRVTYDPFGRVSLVEAGSVTDPTAAALAGMAAVQAVSTAYDGADRPTTQTLLSGTTPYGLTQYSYDHQRLDCTAVRTNLSATLPPSACTPTAGGIGPDQITKNSYDVADRVTAVRTGYNPTTPPPGTSASYNPNGTLATLTDPDNNLTTYAYDGYDRLYQTFYPVPAKGGGTSSATDYEQFGYDADGDQTSRRLRDGTSIIYTYDALGRVTLKNLPGTELDVSYTFDNPGRLLTATQTGNAQTFTYDALGRPLTQTGPKGTMTAEYDAAGRRTKLTWPDAFYVNYDYDTVGDMTAVRENNASSGIGVLAAFTYDSLGNRVKLVRGNGDLTTYTPDPALPASRLSAQFDSLAGATTWNASRTFAYTPAGQLASTVRSNNLYGWTGHYNRNDAYTVNGLNQATAISGTTAETLTYDARGNTTGIGTNAYGYSSENLLTSGPGGITLTYDPLLRLQKTSNGTSATWLLYDGDERTAEYSGSNALLRRYVYGPDTDEPLVWYEGSDTSDRRWLHADERGSVTAVSDASGNALAVDTYDEYGVPASTNLGKFGYTGQAWVPELGLWYYKARMYAPGLGRFLQTDPIGYGDGPNLYGYVHADPVNATDPDGLLFTPKLGPDIIVNGFRFTEDAGEVDGTGGSGGIPGGTGQAGGPGDDPRNDIIVTARLKHDKPRPATGQIRLLLNIISPQNVCSRPLTGAANRGQTVNSRRAQVRRELAQLMDVTRRTGGDLGAAYNFEVGRVSSRLAPGGTWIKGGTSKEDGNILFGAITAELGIPLAGATGFGDVDEMIDDTLGLIGVRPYDGHWGPDSQVAKDQMAAGAGCPG